jgi:hypothetical protein
VERRPFEIVAECEMAGFPSGVDVDRIRERIQEAQRSWPAIVRAAVNPPAVFKDRRYVLQARFVVWAEDGSAATQAVEGLLAGAEVRWRTVLPSGRALTEAEAPPPAEETAGQARADRPARAAVSARAAGPARAAKRAAGSRAARPARTAAGPPRTTKREAGARTGKPAPINRDRAGGKARAGGEARAGGKTRAGGKARAGWKSREGGEAHTGGKPRAGSRDRRVGAVGPDKGRARKPRGGRAARSR